MTTRLYGYTPDVSIVADDTYILAGATPMPGLEGDVAIALTFNGGYAGTVTLKSRRMGSSDAWVTQAYTTPGSTTPVTTALSATGTIFVNNTNKELALVSSGGAGGSVSVGITAAGYVG